MIANAAAVAPIMATVAAVVLGLWIASDRIARYWDSVRGRWSA